MRPPGWAVVRGLPPPPPSPSPRRVPRYRLSYTAACPYGHDATWTGEAWGYENRLAVGYVCHVCSPASTWLDPGVAVAPC